MNPLFLLMLALLAIDLLPLYYAPGLGTIASVLLVLAATLLTWRPKN